MQKNYNQITTMSVVILGLIYIKKEIIKNIIIIQIVTLVQYLY